MWLNQGIYLLEYHKSHKMTIPTKWINYKDLENIDRDVEYKDLILRTKYIDKQLNKM